MTSPAISQPAIFFDDLRGDFGPLSDLRAASELRSGALTNRQRLAMQLDLGEQSLWVSPSLIDLTMEQTGLAVNRLPAERPTVWLVNGRLATLPDAGPDALAVARRSESFCWTQSDGQLLVAKVPVETARAYLGHFDASLIHAQLKQSLPGDVLLSRPWHLLDQLESLMVGDISLLGRMIPWASLPSGVQVVGQEKVHVHPSAKIYPGTVLIAEKGPIFIDQDAVVGALSVLEGPFYLGSHSQVMPQSLMRPMTCVGPHCKVAGEVAHSIFHAYSNKAHAGFFGHGLVGQWVNLGADTNVSNLKNTYGPPRVRLRPDAPEQETGRLFMGPILGDFVRTAIGTRMPTGSCIATGVMLASGGFAPKCPHRLAFYTQEQPEGEPYDMEKFLKTVRAMMARRQQTLGPAMQARLLSLSGI